MFAAGTLKVIGQKDKVSQMVSNIRKEMMSNLDKKLKDKDTKRKAAGLPANTDRLPSYWTVCKLVLSVVFISEFICEIKTSQ